ncbi:helix-turn-helix domain-containing protein [bacterium]|nr:helix-turn-helix domain-containing protein [bacterium]
MLNEENKFNWWNKYLLSVEEAAQYFGIGEKRLREYLSGHRNADFIVLNGTKTLIKKKMFERYIDTQMSVI